MPPKVSARCARGRFQHVNVKLGRPPTAPALSIANIGTSARPGDSYWSILHQTVAAREAVPGQAAFVVRTDLVANGAKADTALPPSIGRD